MPKCSFVTKRAKPCPNQADRYHEGKPVCHVHDPGGTFRLQQRDRKDAKASANRFYADAATKSRLDNLITRAAVVQEELGRIVAELRAIQEGS